MTEIASFTHVGKPIALQRPRFSRTGRVYNPNKYEQQQFAEKVRQYKPQTPFSGPIRIKLKYVFKRPKSHFGTGRNAAILKSGAPTFHTSKPDVDNLVKFTLDAMNGEFYIDDKQVVEIRAEKVYNNECDCAGYTDVQLNVVTCSESSVSDQ